MRRFASLGIKVVAGLVGIATPWLLSRVAWHELFDAGNARFEYWKVFTAGPHYLAQTLLFIEFVCVMALVFDRMSHRARIGWFSFGILGGTSFLGFFVWPTLWIYSVEHQPTKGGGQALIQVRVNRFSGERQELFDEDWQDGHIIVD